LPAGVGGGENEDASHRCANQQSVLQAIKTL
jgi:hypothetical protein